ncbi:putative protein phosphatase 2C 66 isoform X1 [Apium graveolens]|uniref:putative protein phosphatase 2C 66 isoform X1 n=2 Tax=Apium graveolens TaxID=4045 RepID=UPI003D7A60C3
MGSSCSALFRAENDKCVATHDLKLNKCGGVDATARLINNGATNIASLHTQQGKKGTNQDAMIVWENFSSRGETVFCGVFDGHGPYGHMVARKVRDNLPNLLSTQWNNKLNKDQNYVAENKVGNSVAENGNAAENTYPDEHTDDGWCEPLEFEVNEDLPEMYWQLKQSMLKAFKLMDKELMLHPAIDCFCSGSTTVALVKQGQDLVIGNIGDSRAVLATRDKENSLTAVQLTIDLKPNLPREAARITQCKGRVFALQDEPDVPRVWLPNSDTPGLAMARAFGDFCLKDFGLISTPDVYYHRITESDEFVILATDGVWDVISNKEAVDIVASAPGRSTAARALIDCATRAWRLKYPTSKNDDCAVVCLYLEHAFTTDVAKAQSNVTGTPKEEVSMTVDNKSSDIGSISPSHSVMLAHSGTVRCSEEIVPVAQSAEERNSVKSIGQSKRSLADCISTAEEEEWSALEGITRVNSLLSLPRFLSADKGSASWRKVMWKS